MSILCHLGIHAWDYYWAHLELRKRCVSCGVRRTA